MEPTTEFNWVLEAVLNYGKTCYAHGTKPKNKNYRHQRLLDFEKVADLLEKVCPQQGITAYNDNFYKKLYEAPSENQR
jgi:hypothetical protein